MSGEKTIFQTVKARFGDVTGVVQAWWRYRLPCPLFGELDVQCSGEQRRQRRLRSLEVLPDGGGKVVAVGDAFAKFGIGDRWNLEAAVAGSPTVAAWTVLRAPADESQEVDDLAGIAADGPI
ncbi:hypothetical protein G3I15_56840, partial [Streptomyces sp. SID10244]|nr:hypothetical protein [Streptomyces sp. SID10244]